MLLRVALKQGLFCWFWLAAVAVGQQQVRIPTDEELAKALAPIAPRSPAEQRRAMRVVEGLEVELVAAEPHVVDPIEVAFGADGAMYVVEMRDYPFGAEKPEDAGRIRLLRDRDGDGYYETATVFAAGLHWPTSVFPWRDGVLVLAPPDLWYFADTDGDDRADVREVVVAGFGTQNVQALANGLRWSVDCRIYFANGRNGGTLKARRWFDWKRPVVLGGNDVRMLPPGVFELTSGGGQFGHSLDDFGRRFVCNNSDHARFVVLDRRYLARNRFLRITRLLDSIAVEGASAVVYRISPPEPWRVIRTRLRVAGLVPGPIEHGGKAVGYFTSATGITVYRGDALGKAYYGNLFIGDVAGNLVHRKRLLPHGASFRAERTERGKEFLACADLWFRPVNFATGPDGALYICDMYREVVEHPASIPEFMKRHLDLTNGRDRGRIWRVRRAGTPLRHMRLASVESRELVGLLEASNGWIRDTAQRLLLEQQAVEVADALRGLLTGSSVPAARVAALWLLERLGQLDAALLRRAAADRSAAVREHALRVALERADRSAMGDLFVQAATDPAPRVRLYAAYGLGELRTQAATDALARLLADPANDTWIRTAALSSCSPTTTLGEGRPSLAAAVIERLRSTAASSAAAVSAVRRLAEMLAAAGRSDEAAQLLSGAGKSQRRHTLDVALALGLADGAARRGLTVERFLARSEGEGRAVVGWQRLLQRAAQAVREGHAGALEVALLAFVPSDQFPRVAEQLLQPRVAGSLQQHFLRVAGQVRRDGWYRSALAAWRNLTPAVRRTLAESLVARPQGATALLQAVETGAIRPLELDPDIRNRLRADRSAEVRRAAVRLLGSGPSNASRQELIARYRQQGALERGDPRRGAELYKEHCEKCHAKRGKGGAVGPDLNTVRNRDPEALLIAILDPNREVAPEYLTYNVLLTDGRVLNGRVMAETATAITLGKADGSTETILRSSIEQIAASGQSLMPEGFEEQLKPRDVADIVTYLLSDR